MHIPFNKPFVVGKELYYIAQAVTFGNLSGNGQFTDRCARFMEDRFGIPKVLMTPSCTAALEMTAGLLNIGPGDEVIMPSFTFVSTANAFVRFGAKPVFVEIRPDTLNLDETLVEAAITSRTKAIVAVHYAGVACEMNSLLAIGRRHGIPIIEDAAQGVHSYYNGRALGGLGTFGCYSFHETKNYNCGEGGALCVNDTSYIDRAEVIRDKGTNRKQFFRGLVDKYSWVDLGSSYVPSELCSAFLYAQLENLEEILERRREIYENYVSLLTPLADAALLQLPTIPPEAKPNYHMFYCLLPNRAARDGALEFLARRDINAVFHYVPLHSSEYAMRVWSDVPDLPVTDDVSSRLIRLPMYYELTDEQQRRVVAALTEFLTESESVSGLTATDPANHSLRNRN